MKYSAILIATLVIIEISLSDAAAVENKGTGPSVKKRGGNEKAGKGKGGANGKKRTPSEIAAVKKGAEYEEIKPQEEEVTPKKEMHYLRTESTPKPESLLEKTPTPKEAARIVEPDMREVIPKNGNYEKQPLSDLKHNDLPINSANSIGSLEVLQEIKLEIKKLANILENLSLLCGNGLPKTWDSALNSESATTGYSDKLAAVAVTPPFRADTFLPSCKTKNENFNECLQAYLQEMVKYSKEGNPKFSIPPLDPYILPPKMEPKMRDEDFKVKLTNARVYGFSEAKIIEVQSDPANGVFEIRYMIPVAKCQGQYSANGLLTKPVKYQVIRSKGEFEISFIELFHAIKIEGEVKGNSDGNKYLHINSVTVNAEPERMDFKFVRPFGDNVRENKLINMDINDDWYEIFATIQPRLEEEMSKHLYKMISDFFKAVPYNEIFPDI